MRFCGCGRVILSKCLLVLVNRLCLVISIVEKKISSRIFENLVG